MVETEVVVAERMMVATEGTVVTDDAVLKLVDVCCGDGRRDRRRRAGLRERLDHRGRRSLRRGDRDGRAGNVEPRAGADAREVDLPRPRAGVPGEREGHLLQRRVVGGRVYPGPIAVNWVPPDAAPHCVGGFRAQQPEHRADDRGSGYEGAVPDEVRVEILDGARHGVQGVCGVIKRGVCAHAPDGRAGLGQEGGLVQVVERDKAVAVFEHVDVTRSAQKRVEQGPGKGLDPGFRKRLVLRDAVETGPQSQSDSRTGDGRASALAGPAWGDQASGPRRALAGDIFSPGRECAARSGNGARVPNPRDVRPAFHVLGRRQTTPTVTKTVTSTTTVSTTTSLSTTITVTGVGSPPCAPGRD
ncbi:hypothetical protein DFJ74DRAFT_655893 [Hyaloraphidium curvatum]|nr:hypothetical protein DFJ74DRAFT_655893 [Hyaloraphidium curvatum]